MPERPDLEYVVPILDRELRGATITAATAKKPVVLRIAVPGGFPGALVGRSIHSVSRRAHFICFALDGELEMIVSPMLAGRFILVQPKVRAPADLAVAFSLSDRRELRYRDDVQMGKVYLVPGGRHDVIPGFSPIGVDVLDRKAFTLEAFRALARKRRDQVKVFLMDKTALDSFGNAYADETCFAAGIHPKTRVGELSAEQVGALHKAIVSVMENAIREVTDRAAPTDVKVRDFLKVRGRAGEPCAACGTTIRSAGVHGHDAEFCPKCQPEKPGRSIVDWNKLAAR